MRHDARAPVRGLIDCGRLAKLIYPLKKNHLQMCGAH
jgi:hypothetical protein